MFGQFSGKAQPHRASGGKAANAEKVLLKHLYPESDDIDLVAAAKAHWPGETIAATDGLVLEIRGLISVLKYAAFTHFSTRDAEKWK
jgi:hypothetical protein